MAQAQGPETLVNQLSNEVLEAVRADKAIQSGDLQRVIALVDAKVMPHVDAEHIMASHRRSAPPASMATAVSADAHMEALRRIERGTLHEAPEDPLLAYLPHAARRLRRATRPGAARAGSSPRSSRSTSAETNLPSGRSIGPAAPSRHRITIIWSRPTW